MKIDRPKVMKGRAVLLQDGNNELQKAEVISSGHKYFVVQWVVKTSDTSREWKRDQQFHQGTWRQRTDYCATYRLFDSEKELEDLKTRENAGKAIRNAWNKRNHDTFEVEDAIEITRILEKYK